MNSLTVKTQLQSLPHGITLSVRSCGERGRPVLMFLHGFPEAAFVWDTYLTHFASLGLRAVAPNLRGFERSSSPAEASAYRAKHLVQDVAALIEIETIEASAETKRAPSAGTEPAQAQPGLACLIAHDWGGAVAWNVANQLPHLQQKLCIINSPHAGTFLRELQTSPAQQAASQYMNFLARPDAASLLAEADFARLWPFFENMGAGAAKQGWLSEAVKDQYRAVWGMGLLGGCNYYAASPIKPGPDLKDMILPSDMLTISIPTQIIWGMNDLALRPELLDGLDAYIPDLRIHRVLDATHWITHEQPELVKRLIGDFLVPPAGGMSA